MVFFLNSVAKIFVACCLHRVYHETLPCYADCYAGNVVSSYNQSKSEMYHKIRLPFHGKKKLLIFPFFVVFYPYKSPKTLPNIIIRFAEILEVNMADFLIDANYS